MVNSDCIDMLSYVLQLFSHQINSRRTNEKKEVTYTLSPYLCKVKSLGNESWVESILDLNVCLFEHLPNEEDGRGGAISNDVILGSAGLGNHAGSWVLDLLYKRYHTFNSNFHLFKN